MNSWCSLRWNIHWIGKLRYIKCGSVMNSWRCLQRNNFWIGKLWYMNQGHATSSMACDFANQIDKTWQKNEWSLNLEQGFWLTRRSSSAWLHGRSVCAKKGLILSWNLCKVSVCQWANSMKYVSVWCPLMGELYFPLSRKGLIRLFDV